MYIVFRHVPLRCEVLPAWNKTQQVTESFGNKSSVAKHLKQQHNQPVVLHTPSPAGWTDHITALRLCSHQPVERAARPPRYQKSERKRRRTRVRPVARDGKRDQASSDMRLHKPSDYLNGSQSPVCGNCSSLGHIRHPVVNRVGDCVQMRLQHYYNQVLTV